VTPHVANHQGNVDHAPAHSKSSKEIKFQMKKIGIQAYVVVDPDASVQKFLLLYKVDFDFDPKISIHLCYLFYHHANPQKIDVGKHWFQRSNRANRSHVSQIEFF
jgi:hypothetical protein